MSDSIPHLPALRLGRTYESLEKIEVKELAGGWITERKGTPIPAFLKLAYVGFSLFGVAYLFLYRMGEEGHPTRGPLVKAGNQVMQAPPGPWIAPLAVCLIVFIGGLWTYAFKSGPEED